MFRTNIVLRLLSKELRELARDRRALLYGFVLPLLMLPASMLSGAMLPRLLASSQDPSERRVLLWGKLPPEVGAALESSGWVVTAQDQVPDDPAAAFRAAFEAREAQVALAAGNPASLYVNPASPESAKAGRGMEVALQSARLQLARASLVALGLPGSLAEPLRWSRHEIRLPLTFLVRVLPILLLLMLAMAGMHVSLEAVAGERERGTLQTLLSAPIGGLEILAAKLGAIAVAGLASAASTVAALGLTLAMLSGAGADLGLGALGPGRLAMAALGVLSLVVSLSAVWLNLGAIARGYKEGQALASPLLLVLVVPAMVSALPGVKLGAGLALVPFANASLLLRDGLAGAATAPAAFGVLLASLGFAAVALLLATRLFESEQVLMGGEVPWRELLGTALRPGDRLSPRSAVLFAAVVMVLYAGGMPVLAARLPGPWVLVTGQVALLLLPAIAWVKLHRCDLREAFSLRLPSRADLGRLGLLALVVPAISVVLSNASQRLFPGASAELAGQLVAAMRLFAPAGGGLAVALLFFAAVPAICEEAAFRGVVLKGLSRGGSEVAAVAGTAVAFGLLHLAPLHVAIAAVLGAVLSAATLRLRTIAAGVVLHFVNNAFAVASGRFDAPQWPLAVQAAIVAAGAAAAGVLWLTRDAGMVRDARLTSL